MVKALHRAGIEVILDVVFNHTAEGDHAGPTLCYRGLANDFYYILEKNKSCYADYSGCGNTLNANQPIVRRLIQDSLRYWVSQMHVDGFRFDLASILSRDEAGHPLPNPPVLWELSQILCWRPKIARPGTAGLYQVGTSGETWKSGWAIPRRRAEFFEGMIVQCPRLAGCQAVRPYGHRTSLSRH
jgi:glycogen operon protein